MQTHEILSQAQQGFASMPLSDDQKAQALAFLERWLTDPKHEATRPQLEALVAQGAWSLLLDSFYRIIPFGTGGRRGAVGIGPNRLNPTTIGTSVQGHSLYLKQRFPARDNYTVVIAYDVREYHDLRGRYDATKPNPLLGLSSRDFAELAASVYAANGIQSILLPPDAQTYISTPELSYLIRSYQAQGGLNVSASHNHPDDNGGKFYNEDGGQPIPPHDQEMSTLVEQVQEVHQLPFEEAVAQGMIHWLPLSKRQEYIELNFARRFWEEEPRAVVAYTPMNGTGSTSVGKLLQRAGYTLHTLPSQADFDGSFEKVRYRTPNPEVVGAMQDVVEYAQEVHADLALATDPDADRIGLAAPDAQGQWRCFNGNELATLLTHYLLTIRKEQQQLPQTPLILKTQVTTNLIERITASFGGRCVGDLLVGFKYIGDALHQWEQKGTFQGVPGTLDDFVLGTEESHGFLTTPDLRDKDAAGAGLYLAELASLLKAQGRTFQDQLDEIYQTYGYFRNTLNSMVMEGAVGLANIQRMQTSLRENPPKQIAGLDVVEFFDHWNEEGRFGPIVSETARSSRNVLVFHLQDDIRLILRPSGTEPKTKLYVEVPTPPLSTLEDPHEAIDNADKQAKNIAKAFAHEALQRIGVSLPDYALAISDLVSVDTKQTFANTILPAWQTKLDALDNNPPQEQLSSIATWLQKTLNTHKLPAPLLADAIETLNNTQHHNATLLQTTFSLLQDDN